MSSLILQSNAARPWWRDIAAFPFVLYREWEVRRQIAGAQRLDGAFLRDVGVGSGELESVIRHGRESKG